MKGIFERLGKSRVLSIIAVLLMIFSSLAVLGSISSIVRGDAPYTATFNEANLPVGTTWSVILYDSSWHTIANATNTTTPTGGSIVFPIYDNGNYFYKVIGTRWWVNNTVNVFTVSGASVTITINFTENFALTVVENGLLNGMNWSAGIGRLSNYDPDYGFDYDFADGYPFTTNSSSYVIIYHGSTEFSVEPIFGYNISFPNMNVVPANESITGLPIYYSDITIDANTTLIVNFTPIFNVVTVKGYVSPNGTNISSLDFISFINSKGNYSINNIVANGFYEITTTQFANLLFYKTGYYPQVVRISSSQSVQWVNVTLEEMSVAFNISQILTIENYNNLSWIYNFNLSNAPDSFSYIENGIYFARITQNELVVFANLSALPPFPGQGASGQLTLPPLIMNVTFKLDSNQKYMFLVYTNKSPDPIKFVVDASSNGYTTINLNKYTNNFTLDPLIEYSTVEMPKAVITAPSVVTYNSTVMISGANSTPSTNATIVNWTWKIMDPLNQSYIKYGETITQYFSIVGIYTVNLTITDSNNLTNTTSTTINVVPASQNSSQNQNATQNSTQNSMPKAVITAPLVVACDSAVVISGENSTPSANATIINWTWKITGPQGQSYTEYGKTITQYFSIAGIYTITLTVTDSNGLTNTTTTTINVVSASQDLKIKITYTLTVLSNGYYEYDVIVYAQDNVSIGQFLASVDSAVYLNATFIKQVGYAYYYQVVFNPDNFGYGNHTIKFEAINTLNGYNTLITYATFGSVNKGGIIAYIFGHLALTIVILIFIVILASFIYVLYKNRLYRKIKHSRRVKVRRR